MKMSVTSSSNSRTAVSSNLPTILTQPPVIISVNEKHASVQTFLTDFSTIQENPIIPPPSCLTHSNLQRCHQERRVLSVYSYKSVGRDVCIETDGDSVISEDVSISSVESYSQYLDE